MSNTVEVFAFLCEYFDANAQLVKRFRLNYFADGELALTLSSNRRLLCCNPDSIESRFKRRLGHERATNPMS